MKKIVQAMKDKIAYEKESYRMSSEELERSMREHPEMYRRGKKGK